MGNMNGEIAARAVAEIGKPYQWSAVGPSAYDCSGLVSYCVSGTHKRIGTTTTFMGWPRRNPSEMQPGDICVCTELCGIYVGGGQMISIAGPGTMVSYMPIRSGMIIVEPTF